MRSHLIFIISLITTASIAQGISRDSIAPSSTEVWEFKPKKITAYPSFTQPPSDAIILFSGKDLAEWSALDGANSKWEVKDGIVTVMKGAGDIKTKKVFGDMQLHIEWRTPAQVEGSGQGRGNSGIFLQEKYEIQVLDSYENETYSNGGAGSIYKQSIPLVNPTRKPGEWQAYDIIYTSPRFSENGRVLTPAYVTVILNGVLIQNNTQIWGATEYRGLPLYKPHCKASIKLQDHGNPVSYRNIWVREL
jgi:hypothetical protein